MTLSITRHFSTDIAGNALFGIAIVTVLGQVLTFGCHQSATKITGTHYHASNWLPINKDLSAFSISITCTGAALALISLFSYYLLDKIQLPLITLVVGATAAALIQLYSGALIGIQRQNSATLFLNGLTPLLCAIGVFTLVQINEPLSGHQLIQLYVVSISTTLLLTLTSWYFPKQFTWHFQLKMSENTFNHAKHIYPVVLAQLSTQYASQFAIAYYLSESDFAFFSSALRTSLLVSFILMAANLVVAGKFAQFYAQNQIEKINKLALQSSRILVLLAFPIGILTLVFSDTIMSLFGPEYVAGSSALQIMVLGQLINVATGSTNYLLSMCGQERALRTVLFFTFILAIILAILLTPFIGITGAALGTAIAVATQNLFATHYVKQYLGFNCLNIFRKIN